MASDREENVLEQPINRRQLLAGGLGLAATGGLFAASRWGVDKAAAAAGAVAGGVPDAKTLVAKWERPPTVFQPPGPAFDASRAKGKTVWGVFILSIPFAQINKAGYEAGLKAAGVKLVAFDGKGQVQETSRGIEQGVGQRADLILAETLPAKLFSSDLAKAKSVGIPVLWVENQDPGARSPDEPKAVLGGIDQCHRCVGRIMSDFTIADSGGKGKAVIVWSPDIPGIGVPQLKGIKEEFQRLAPNMKVDVKGVPIARWDSGLPTLTQTLVRDPDVKYLLPFYDGMVLFMLPSVHAAGAQDRVKIVTFNASPSVLESLKKGDVVAANIGANPEQFGWAFADQTLRVLSGVKPLSDPKLPIRLFTKANINTIDLKAPQQTWYGNVDFKSGYKKLWGVAG